MPEVAYGIKITAHDETQQTLRQSLANFKQHAHAIASILAKPITVPIRLARSGIGLLRDIEIGIRPALDQIDRLISRSAGLEAITKSFQSLTGATGRDMDILARRLVNAAHGTITMANAMEVANRALGSGLSFTQLITALEYTSLKATSVGQDVSGAIDQVMESLATGRPRGLEPLGLLLGGVEQIKANFEKLHGTGAFDALDTAAQRAIVINEALSQMQSQMSQIGLSGKEIAFQWASIKSEVAGWSEALSLSHSKSETLKKTLEEVRKTVAGIGEHLTQGGSIQELIFGKSGGESKGLFGLLSAGLGDVGDRLKSALSIGMKSAVADMLDAFADAIPTIKAQFEELWKDLKAGPIQRAESNAQVIGEAIKKPRLGATMIDQALQDVGMAQEGDATKGPANRLLDWLNGPSKRSGKYPLLISMAPATSQPAASQPSTTATSQPTATHPAAAAVGAHVQTGSTLRNLAQKLRKNVIQQSKELESQDAFPRLTAEHKKFERDFGPKQSEDAKAQPEVADIERRAGLVGRVLPSTVGRLREQLHRTQQRMRSVGGDRFALLLKREQEKARAAGLLGQTYKQKTTAQLLDEITTSTDTPDARRRAHADARKDIENWRALGLPVSPGDEQKRYNEIRRERGLHGPGYISGGEGTRREALKETDIEANRRRKLGLSTDASWRREYFRQKLIEKTTKRLDPLRQEAEGEQQLVDTAKSFSGRKGGTDLQALEAARRVASLRNLPDAPRNKAEGAAIEDAIKKMGELIAKFDQFMSAMTGTSNRVQQSGR